MPEPTPTPVEPTPTPADQLKALQGEADALAKAQAAAAADAKAMQKAFEDGEKEIAAYVAEHAKLASDTDTAKGGLQEKKDKIKQLKPAIAAKVDKTITDYDAALTTKNTEYTAAVSEADTKATALKTAEKAAATKQEVFDKSKGDRERWKARLSNLTKSVTAADAKDDADLYAEAYAIAAVPLPVDALPSVEAFAKAIRDAWTELGKARKALRGANDDYVRAVRTRDDLKATIDDLAAKRADNILKEVVEEQAGSPAPAVADPSD